MPSRPHAGNHRWQLRFDESLSPDIIIAARLQPGNEEILDYYLLPRLDVLTERLSLRPENGLILDVYRFNNLNFFMEMAQRVRVEGDCMKEQIIERIPIAQIHIANPRPRSRGRWQMIVANIREVGLKKPITVVRRSEPDADGKQFDLVCGQGRIEAFLALGETTIPAIIAEASREDQFLMSLVENIARRPPSNRDILREVRSLRERGYNVAEIARKIGMERMYISGIVHLVEHKEVALIEAVEAGQIAHQRRSSDRKRKRSRGFRGSFAGIRDGPVARKQTGRRSATHCETDRKETEGWQGGRSPAQSDRQHAGAGV